MCFKLSVNDQGSESRTEGGGGGERMPNIQFLGCMKRLGTMSKSKRICKIFCEPGPPGQNTDV